MKQHDIILSAMINNPAKVIWTAKDFQKEPHFVGYEATARMSELAKMIPEIFIVSKQGKYRALSINWGNPVTKEYIALYKEDYVLQTFKSTH